MGKHHTEDYKLSAVKYALRTDNQVETCEVFDCKRSSLQDWLKLYDETGSPVRHTRKQRTAYKVKKEYIDFLRQELHKKPDIFMEDLRTLLVNKYPDADISREHIGRLLRDNNKTRKRLRKKHGSLYNVILAQFLRFCWAFLIFSMLHKKNSGILCPDFSRICYVCNK